MHITMKKNLLMITAISVSVALASCGGGEVKEEVSIETETEVAAIESVNWMVDTENSNIRWTGETAGAMVYSHFGDIKIKSGKLSTEGGNITAGNLIVDMTTIDPKDEGYSEENPAAKLVGHLATADFFNVEEYPESSFEITSVEGNTIKGNLSIRGNVNEETINIESIDMKDGMMTANGKLVFDRQKYDVAWEHFLEDTVLSDDITLEITLVAKGA